MRRDRWLFVVLGLSICAVAAGWFAVNAPEVSRPRFADLGPVALPETAPPLPPAPSSRPEGGGYEAAQRRLLFAPRLPSAAPTARPATAVAAPDGVVAFRGVIPPLGAAPRADWRPLTTDRAPVEAFQAGFGIPRPTHRQFFGGHLLPASTRAADQDPPPPPPAPVVAATQTSAGAPLPRPRPADLGRRGAGGDGPARSDGAPAGASEGPDPSLGGAAAALEDGAAPDPGAASRLEQAAAAEGESGAAPDIIVLGVLLGRGAERALVRTPDGENRRVTRGDMIAGWRVSSIGEDFIRLRRASQTRELRVPQ